MHPPCVQFTVRWVALMTGAAHATTALRALSRQAGAQAATTPPEPIRTDRASVPPAATWPPGFVLDRQRPAVGAP